MTGHEFNPWLDLGLLVGCFALMLIIVVGIPRMWRWYMREWLN